jgi:hypothetical protein
LVLNAATRLLGTPFSQAAHCRLQQVFNTVLFWALQRLYEMQQCEGFLDGMQGGLLVRHLGILTFTDCHSLIVPEGEEPKM